jgi:signal transduction histidine kinase
VHPTTKNFLRWLVLAFLLPATLSSPAREAGRFAGQDYVIRVFGADDGLTEGSVTDVAQTPEGYLWIGTLFGSVLRFDGTRFVSYNSASTPEFSLKWGVPHFMVGKEGTLWISMYDGGMTAWTQRGFRSVFIGSNQPDRLLWSTPAKATFAYGDGKLLLGEKTNEQWNWQTVTLPDVAPQGQHCADAEGRIWFLQRQNQLGIWHDGEIKTIALPDEWKTQSIKALAADKQGRIWIGTDKLLASWETGHFENQTPTNGEAELNVKRTIFSGGGNIWIEANGKMRRCLDRQWQATCDDWSNELGKQRTLRFTRGDNEGGFWTSAGDLGLIHIAADGSLRQLTTRDGLPSNTIRFAYEDRDGNIWTGYDRGGLVQVHRRLFQSIGRDEGLDDSLINTVCEDSQGAIWIGTHSGVAGRYENGICTNLTLPGRTKAQDSCVTADADGRVWIGAQGTGLVLYENGQMRTIASQTQLQGYPRLLAPGRDGCVWVGTLWSIICVTNENLVFAYNSQAVNGHPTALAVAADGTVWAGTLAGTLLRWDGKQFVTLEPPDRNSLGRIWALWPATDGSLWAGTEEGGLLHWSNGKFFRYTMKDGLPSDSIVQILGDAPGNLWLGTRAGIVRIFAAALAKFERGELTQLPVSVYGQSDGLQTIGSAIIYQPNCWRARDGTLLFAMANSVAAVNPEQVHINPLPPAVALEEMYADDKLVWPTRAGAVLTAAQSAGKKITLKPGRGDLEFGYTGLSLGSPLRVQFKYKLEGLDSTWNFAGAGRKAVYRHVPPGEYVFRVVAYNSDGVHSSEGDLLTVTVSPHFYQTVWFRGGVVCFAILALSLTIAIVIRQRMRRRMEHLERQHELERERTRIAQDLHDDLGAGLTEVGLLGGLLQDPARLATRKQEALDRIVHRCHDMVVALDEIVWAVNPRNDSVNSAISYLSRFAQSFLEPTAIRCRLEMHEADPDHSLNSEQRHNLFLAFKEALNNVAKHSGASEVRITILCVGKKLLSISIEDNGRGLPAAVQSDADGLGNLHQRLTQIGGSCEIKNLPSGGVAVHLSLPFDVRKK